MKLGRIEKRKLKMRRSEAVILFSVASQKLAIAAQAVEEIRNTDGLRSLHQGMGPDKVGKVKQVLERDDEIYFVVDANQHLRMLSSRSARLLLMRDSDVALSVDAIDRMAEVTVLHPLPRAFRGEERNWYRGLVLIGEDVVPVLNPAALLSKPELAALRSRMMRCARTDSATEMTSSGRTKSLPSRAAVALAARSNCSRERGLAPRRRRALSRVARPKATVYSLTDWET